MPINNSIDIYVPWHCNPQENSKKRNDNEYLVPLIQLTRTHLNQRVWNLIVDLCCICH